MYRYVLGTKMAEDLKRYEELIEEAKNIRGVSLRQDAWRRLKKNRAAFLAMIFLGMVAFLSFFTPFLPLQAPRQVDTSRQKMSCCMSPLFYESLKIPGDPGVDPLHDPLEEGFGRLGPVSHFMLQARVKIFGRWSLNSLCGTDKLGRDVLSRIFWGSRFSLVVGLVATIVSLFIGITYGAISGYCGGKVDNLMMRAVDVLYSIPFFFIVIFLITVLDAKEFREILSSWGINRVTVFFFVVGAIYWLTMARVVRGQVMSLKNEQFIEAARVVGAGPLRIIFHHLVPNLMSVAVIYLTLTIPNVMLFEAFLSFIGLGVEPPDISWGMLTRDGLDVITPVNIDWWLVVYPSMALALTLFALNFLGDGLRDALDPKQQK
ncbi:MAG: ABC transporter permease [Planctomycetia bacterium]|nr:ABC transporter permease [Planctomycetia bacterium]